MAVLVVFAFGATSASSQAKAELIQKAQSAYYNIPKRGVAEFQCSITPDWTTMLAEQLKTEVKPDNPGLTLLRGVHFWVSVSGTGKTKLSHEADVSPMSKSDLDNFQKAIGGVEETVDGFWKSASIFLLTSAFPRPETAYGLTEKDGSYVISYAEGKYDVVTTLAKNDYAIAEIKVTSSALSSSLKPKFTKADGALLLVGYDSEYRLGSEGRSHISVQIKYQDVEGLHLPSELAIQTSTDVGSNEMRLHLADYQIKRR